jgi:enterochelin esterase-like enzyme
VDYVPLAANRGQVDCGAAAADAPVCRMRGTVDTGAMHRRLAAGTTAWRAGESIVFAWRGAAEGVQLQGGLQYPMSRVRGTDLWTIALQVRDVSRLTLSYMIIPISGEIPRDVRYVPKQWRGPDAPPAALRATALRGTIATDSIASGALGESRRIIVYTPPGTGEIGGVVYLGDGGSVPGFAPYVDTLIATGRLPRVLLVGIENARPRPGDPVEMDRRALEYLWDFDSTNVRFRAHERFVLDEVIPWAEARHGAPAVRERRAVAGMSNSGGWALQMALRHPAVIGHAIAFSPGGARHGALTAEHDASRRARFHLLSGTLEAAFNRAARKWAETFAANGIEHTAREVVAAHDWQMWADNFGGAVAWAFGGSGDRALRGRGTRDR